MKLNQSMKYEVISLHALVLMTKCEAVFSAKRTSDVMGSGIFDNPALFYLREIGQFHD